MVKSKGFCTLAISLILYDSFEIQCVESFSPLGTFNGRTSLHSRLTTTSKLRSSVSDYDAWIKSQEEQLIFLPKGDSKYENASKDINYDSPKYENQLTASRTNGRGYEEQLNTANATEFIDDSMMPAAGMVNKPWQFKASTESEVWNTYVEWCSKYSKSPDDRRFQVFFDHYIQMESYSEEKNTPLQLSQYADMTLDQYHSMLSNVMTQGGVATYTKPKTGNDSIFDQIVGMINNVEEVSSKIKPFEATAEKIRKEFQFRLEEKERNQPEQQKIDKENAMMREEARKKRQAEQEKALTIRLAEAEAAAIAEAKLEVMREEARKKCEAQGEKTLVQQLAYTEVTSMAKEQQVYAKADMVGNPRQVKAPTESEVWDVYAQWCRHFSKLPDDGRFQIFVEHYMQMESYARQQNVPLQLTEHADMTLEELMIM